LARRDGRAMVAAMSLLPVFEHDDPALAPRFDRSTSFAREVEAQVHAIVDDVRARGDAAVRDYTHRFDGREPGPDGSYQLSRAEWHRRAEIAPAIRAALEHAAERIRSFHEHQHDHDVDVVRDGIRLSLRVSPLARVGVYVPGGTARYPSSVLMTAIPARVAGVGEIVMVTPGASAETLAAAEIAGVDRVFEIGGAQAVAALAYGTLTVPRVDKIVGPGNQWVAAAKRLVFGQVDIDSVAGPSEVMIIADDSADPAWVAADLLAQAEHDVLARAILVTTDRELPAAVERALSEQLESLPRAAIARTALEHWGAAIVVDSLEQAIAVANRYAPEHLELDVREPRALVPRLHNAGAIFVGKWAAEAAGDYLAGANHVLPTGGAARYASPLGVYDFVRRTSIVEYDRAAALADADVIAALAAVEGLDGHGRSALIRKGKTS
jgi:histidinol dehydrogenase